MDPKIDAGAWNHHFHFVFSVSFDFIVLSEKVRGNEKSVLQRLLPQKKLHVFFIIEFLWLESKLTLQCVSAYNKISNNNKHTLIGVYRILFDFSRFLICSTHSKNYEPSIKTQRPKPFKHTRKTLKKMSVVTVRSENE